MKGQIVLVIRFSRIELLQRYDLCNDGSAENTIGC